MSKLTGADLEKAVEVLDAADAALDDWLADNGLDYEDLPDKYRQMLERIVIAVLHFRDGQEFRAARIAESHGMVERQSGSPAMIRPQEPKSTEEMRRALLQRIANLRSTNKTERGTPNQISHDTGWQGALELMEEAVKEVVK